MVTTARHYITVYSIYTLTGAIQEANVRREGVIVVMERKVSRTI
jgi:hypothetical protein